MSETEPHADLFLMVSQNKARGHCMCNYNWIPIQRWLWLASYTDYVSPCRKKVRI